AAPDRVAVPGHAVPPVPVQAQPRGAQRLAELGPGMLAERIPGRGEHRVGQGLTLAVETHQPRHLAHPVGHPPPLAPPGAAPAPRLAPRRNRALAPVAHPGRPSPQAPRDRCLRRTVPSSGARPASSDTSSSEPWNAVFTPPSIGHYQTHIRGPPRLVLHPR